jgi:hypothetical protein
MTTHSVICKAGEFRKNLMRDNPEPSREYTSGRCRDYWRGIAPLITSLSARPEREEIVHSGQ